MLILKRSHLLHKHTFPHPKIPYRFKMSTFTIPNTEVSVKLIDGLSKEQLLGFPAFENWIKTLQSSLALQYTNPLHEFHSTPFSLQSITIQAIDRFGPHSTSRIGFIKLSASITNAVSESLPGAVFLRGASVAMLVILQPDDLPTASEAEKHVLLTVQPRIAAGSLGFVELPAGMVDDGTFKGAAAKEIEEELGLKIPEDELVNLSEMAMEGDEVGEGQEVVPRAMFPSAGGCDEYVPIFMHEKRVPRSQLKEWTGKLTGLREEGEKITLKLIKLEDLWKVGARDAKALGAWALLEGLKRTGKL